ncbi:MAG: DUF1015 family protein [Thermoplasmatales archaeon]
MKIDGFTPYIFSGNIADFLTPPVDMLSEDDIKGMAGRNYNAAALIFNQDPASHLSGLVSSGKLQSLGKKKSMLVLSQEFAHNGAKMSRVGLICSLDMGTNESELIPHESTIREYVEKRKDFLKKTEAQLEPVFIVAPKRDLENELFTALDRGKMLLSFDDSAGVKNSLYTIDDEQSMRAISNSLSGTRGIIADGHHRVRAIIEVNRERERKGLGTIPLLSYVTSLYSPSMVISGVHRIVKNEKEDVIERLASGFRSTERGDRRVNGGMTLYDGSYKEIRPRKKTLETLRSNGLKPVTFADFSHFLLYGNSGANYEIYSSEGISFTPYERIATNQVDMGVASAALLMPNWEKKMLIKVVSSGRLLPPKSTFFTPKIFAGITVAIHGGNSSKVV